MEVNKFQNEEETLQLVAQKYKMYYKSSMNNYTSHLDAVEEMNLFVETCNLPGLNH